MEFSPSVGIELPTISFSGQSDSRVDKMNRMIIRLFFALTCSSIVERKILSWGARTVSLWESNLYSLLTRIITNQIWISLLFKLYTYTYKLYIIVIYYCNIVIMYKFLPSVVQIYSADAIKKKTALFMPEISGEINLVRISR